MNDDHLNHEVEFEQEDLRAKPIVWFMVGLGAILVLVYFLMQAMYAGLNRYDFAQAQKLAQNPLVKTNPDPEQRRGVSKADTQDQIRQIFPDPRLEEDERGELQSVINGQEEMLHRYDYVDRSAGVVRIPIERAMQLIAQRGLPTRPEGAAANAKPAPPPAKAR